MDYLGLLALSLEVVMCLLVLLPDSTIGTCTWANSFYSFSVSLDILVTLAEGEYLLFSAKALLLTTFLLAVWRKRDKNPPKKRKERRRAPVRQERHGLLLNPMPT